MLFKQLNSIGLNINEFLYENGLLIAAAYREKKSYKLDSIIFKDIEEFKNFIDIVEKNFYSLAPREVNFIVPGKHWLSGKIVFKIDEDPYATKDERKSVKLLLLDPLTPRDYYFSNELINKLGQSFRSTKIYVHKEEIQHSASGCQVFALFLGLLKISSLEHSFTSKYGLPDIFSYLEKQARSSSSIQENITIKVDGCYISIPIYKISLPLPFLSLAETKGILNNDHLKNLGYTQEEIDHTGFTKTGRKLTEKWANNFKFNESRNIQQNDHLQQTFIKFIARGCIYCLTHNEDQVKSEMNKFSGETYINKLKEELITSNTLPIKQNIPR